MKRISVCVLLCLIAADGATAARSRIGRSVEGRPIHVRELGDPSSHHKVLVVGCIHGNECAGKAVIRTLRRMHLPADLHLWLVDDFNPDGSTAGTRQNSRGVDLNRNFSYQWRGGGEPGDTYYPGPRPFSEPESRAVRDFVVEHRPDITIWYHQQMSLVVKMPKHRAVQRRYARLVDLPLRDIGKLHGTATRWQNHRFPGHISFVVELPGGTMSPRSARRHARAVLEVGRML
jgi:murein peptide amidase A